MKHKFDQPTLATTKVQRKIFDKYMQIILALNQFKELYRPTNFQKADRFHLLSMQLLPSLFCLLDLLECFLVCFTPNPLYNLGGVLEQARRTRVWVFIRPPPPPNILAYSALLMPTN